MLRMDWNTGDSSTEIRVFRSSFTFENKFDAPKAINRNSVQLPGKAGHERTWAFALRSSVSLTDC